MSWLPSPAVSLCPCMQSLISPQAPATCISKTHLDDQRIKCVLYILLVVQTYPNPHTVNDFLSQRCEKQTVPANSSSTLPCYLQQNCNSATNSHTNCAMCLFSGTLSDTEDNALQSGKSKKKAGIILNSNMWKKGHDLRLKWDEEDGWNHSFLTLADELEGIFDEKELFQFYNGRDGDLCLLCEVWEVPSTPPQKRDIFLLGVTVPSLILFWRMMVRSSLPSLHWTLSFSQFPRRTHVNLSSHLREAQVLGVIMTYRRLPMGRGWAWLPHVHAHEHTPVHHPHLSTPS